VRGSDVLSRIDEGELIGLTRDLVRIPSVVRAGQPDANEAAVAAHVEAWMRAHGFDVEVHDVAPGRPNVLGSIGYADGPTLLLEGHTDVVTEGDAALWKHAPLFGLLLFWVILLMGW
jgi:succinyl-diaminopimelate desuccinylase